MGISNKAEIKVESQSQTVALAMYQENGRFTDYGLVKTAVEAALPYYVATCERGIRVSLGEHEFMYSPAFSKAFHGFCANIGKAALEAVSTVRGMTRLEALEHLLRLRQSDPNVVIDEAALTALEATEKPIQGEEMVSAMKTRIRAMMGIIIANLKSAAM